MVLAKYSFTPFQRYAVYTVHGEKCYLCSKPIDLKTMEIDHIIPESLLDDPDKLNSVLVEFGLPMDFNLNSYQNWLPACRSCNNEKSNRVFKPAPIILARLQHTADKSGDVAKLERETITKRKLSLAINTLERASELEEFSLETIGKIRPLIELHLSNRTPDLVDKPIKLTPLYTILSEDERMRVVRGPYGVGSGPTYPSPNSGFTCPSCGHAARNGARCVICGELSDD